MTFTKSELEQLKRSKSALDPKRVQRLIAMIEAGTGPAPDPSETATKPTPREPTPPESDAHGEKDEASGRGSGGTEDDSGDLQEG